MKRTILLLMGVFAMATLHATANFQLSGNTLHINTQAMGEIAGHTFSESEKEATTVVVSGHVNFNDMVAVQSNFAQTLKNYDLGEALMDDYEAVGGYQSYVITNLTNLESIVFPKACDIIPSNICSSLQHLNKVVIPEGCKSIGNNAFSNCSSLLTVNLPNSITHIGSKAFYSAHLTSLRLPDHLTKVEESCFESCQWLTSLVIPADVKTLGKRAFYGCNRLRDIYCLGKEAPEWEGDEATQYGNLSNAFDNTTLNNGNNIEIAAYDEATNVMARRGYWNGTMDNSNHIGCAVLHIPNDLTEEQLAKYADVSKINLENGTNEYISEDGKTKWPSQAQLTEYYKESAWRKFAVVSYYTPKVDEREITNIYDDTWYTIVLPFSMTKDEVERTFGVGTELCKFVGIKKASIMSGGDQMLDFSLNTNLPTVFEGEKVVENDPTSTILEADQPYMIRPQTAPDETGKVTYRFVGIKNMNVTGDDSKLADGVLGTMDGEDGYEAGYRFIGTYNTGLDKKVIPYGYYFLSRITKGEKAKAYYRETSRNQNRTTDLWKANTCCVIPPSMYAQSAKSMFNIWSSELEGSDNQTTGISSALLGEKNDVQKGNVYTLQGQYVGKSENLCGLASGIYVVNGKKYVVK